MTPVLLALTLAAAPELWVTSDGQDPVECDSRALAAAVTAHRPGARVHPWTPGIDPPPAAGAVTVKLAASGDVTRLEIRGPGAPVVRTLPATDGCKRNLEVAALIVDGALDDLAVPGAAPLVESLAPPVPFRKKIELGLAVGAGIEQNPQAFVPSLDAEAVFRYRFVELTLDVDVGLGSSRSFHLTPPESTSATGTMSVSTVATELGLGVAPRVGRSRFIGDILLGVSVASFSASAASAGTLFQGASRTSAELYTGLRLGYAVDLPLGLFLAAHAEERLAPNQATFSVDEGATPGSPPANSSVSTWTWSFQAVGMVGVRFF